MGGFRTMAAVCCAMVLVFGWSATGMAKDKFEQEVETEAVAVKLVRDVQQGGYDLVTAEALKGWIDQGRDMLVVDTMPYDDSYKKQHVPGAVQFLFPIPDMPEWDVKETDGKTVQDYEALLGPDKTKTIVVYCGFVKCRRSHNGAAWAKKLGYQNVYRFPGGIFAWKGSDYPIEKAK
jgi:thiosulfate/3-mercaptopyruvate sulfurtransferase